MRKKVLKWEAKLNMNRQLIPMKHGQLRNLVMLFISYILFINAELLIEDKRNDDDNQFEDKTPQKRNGGKKELWQLKTDQDGNPVLPKLSMCPKRESLKSLIRSMVTLAYSKNPCLQKSLFIFTIALQEILLMTPMHLFHGQRYSL